MSPVVRRRVGAIVPWLALCITLVAAITSSAVTWGQTCERVDVLEEVTSEHRGLVQAQVEALDARLRAVEQATEVIPSMAQDIRDIRNFLLETRQEARDNGTNP